MKIVLAVHHFPPKARGGAELQAYRIARWLINFGNSVQVICIESIEHGYGQTLKSTDDVYEGIPVHRLHFNLKAVSDPFKWSYNNPLLGEYMFTFLQTVKPDVFHLISGYLMSGSVIWAAKELGLPVVLTPIDFWFLCPLINLVKSDGTLCHAPDNISECLMCLCKERRRYRIPDELSHGLLGWVLKHPVPLNLMGLSKLASALKERRDYLQRTFRMVDVAISNSQFLKNFLMAKGVISSNFLCIRQGLELEHQEELKFAPSYNGLRIGYIGQVAKHKGVDILLKAFRRIKAKKEKPELTIYGDLKQFPSFVRHLNRLAKGNDRIHLAGPFDNRDISRVHANIDVLVVPSIWYENSPNVILEAFSARIPVIVSNLGGMAELVQHGANGLCFTPGNVDELAQQLQMIVDDQTILERLKQNIPPVKTVQEEVSELVHIYRSLVTGSQL
ncbi:MAG: glycosyltransferase family 4 protein [Anaerolineae bacterium]